MSIIRRTFISKVKNKMFHSPANVLSITSAYFGLVQLEEEVISGEK